MSCSHSHDSCGHGHGGHDHDDDHIKPGEGQQDYLYSSINRDATVALNESSPNSGRLIIKPYAERTTDHPALTSDSDAQLLLHVPFLGIATLRALLLKSGPASHTPATIHVFTNRDDLDFDAANDAVALPRAARGAPAQTFDSVPVTREVVEFPLRPAKFRDVRSVQLFVPDSQGEETSRISFVGFKGQHSELRRQGPTNIIYEAAPSVKDHVKVPGTEAGGNTFGQGQ